MIHERERLHHLDRVLLQTRRESSWTLRISRPKKCLNIRDLADVRMARNRERKKRVKFLIKPFEIYSRMKAVYGDKCLSQNRIFEWARKFKSGIESLDDAPRPGAPVKVSDYATTWAIDEMIQKDRHIRIRVISAELNLIYVSVQKIIDVHI
ncbi:hypothetical protein LAZ67_3000489 [Cordylochernes scorpioides]|uniref:Mos1 transposase HTH domain-containing protein n=1 Tax=Cordylochernes scorpioides TaxID=51811 RepID=A0ABY6K691_9ARAC|nr:hypothetical protein LAZ67_3000489 [Cordylochernes scorpioides]